MLLRRTFITCLLLAICAGVAYQYGFHALPDLSLEMGIGLALALGIVFAIAVRLLILALFGSLLLAILVIAATIIVSQYFFLEYERDRWYANQQELPQQAANPEKERRYMQSLDLEHEANPLLNWFNHAEYQIQSGLQSQQLKPNQLGVPKPAHSSGDVFSSWLIQLSALIGSVFAGALFGRGGKK